MLLQPKRVVVKGKDVMATYVYQPPGQSGPAPRGQVQGRLRGDAALSVTGEDRDPLDPGMDTHPATHADNDMPAAAAAAAAGSSFLQLGAGAQPRGSQGGSSHTELQPRGSRDGGSQSSSSGPAWPASMDGHPEGPGGRSGSPGSTGAPGMAVAAAAGGGPGWPMGFQQLVGQIVGAKANLLSRGPNRYMDRTSMPHTESTVWHGKGDGVFSLIGRCARSCQLPGECPAGEGVQWCQLTR